MLKAALAAVLGLAAFGHSLVLAEDRLDTPQTLGSVAPSRLILSSTDIVHIKAALKLTREQEQYWPPVEAALRAITGRAAQGVATPPQPIVFDQANVDETRRRAEAHGRSACSLSRTWPFAGRILTCREVHAQSA